MLIALLLGTVIVGAVVTVLVVYVFNFEQTDDITAARQRGEMVLSILEGPVLHAGLGMPDSPDFYDSFKATGPNVDTLLKTKEDVLKLPVQVEPEDTSTDLYICYAMPSRNVILESADVTGGSFDISMEKDINNTYIEANRNTFKSWVTFPTGGVPLYVTDKNADKLTIKAAQETGSRISQYDELSYIRAMHAWVYEGTFYTEDLTIQGQQPRVEGIEDIFFDYDSDNGLLTVYILARGNQKDSDFAKENVLGWPEDKGAQEISNSQYRLAVVRGSWRIRN
jgi:hypothetical protein